MRLIDIENIDYVRLEDSLHCLEHHKGDEVECVICASAVEAIPKDEVIAMLKELKREIEKLDIYEIERKHGLIEDGYVTTDVSDIIQQKINNLKENKNEKN